MRLYLAAAEAIPYETALGGLDNVALLASFWYIKNGPAQKLIDWATTQAIPLFLDSGAYSAMTMNVKIDIDEYTAYCLQYQYNFDVIASLDVIGDYRATARNHDYMRSKGVECIPTFHVNAPFSELDRLVSENPYVALGVAGMQHRRKQLMAWLVRCFQVNAGRAKFHGFALTSPRVMCSFPWYSVDSSTWLNGNRFGTIIVRDRHGFRQVQRRDQWKIVGKVPKRAFMPRKAPISEYVPLLRWNASQMLSWAKDFNHAAGNA